MPDPACTSSFVGLALHLDRTGTVIRAWGTGLGWTGLVDPTGQRYDAVIPAAIVEAADLPTRIGEALSTALPIHLSGVEVLQGSSPLHLRVKVIPLPDRSFEVLILLDDVSDAVEAVVRAERQACQARTAVLAANVAHEMRNPLSALSLALQVVEASDPRHRSVLEKVQALVVRLDRIVEDLVEFSRPPPVTLRLVDLAGLVRGALPATLPKARVRVDGPAMALADPSLFQQALASLLASARDAASAPDRVEVHVGPGPRVAVSDDRPPLPASTRDRLLAPFSRVGSRGDGGLALATARKLVEAMGGTLDLPPTETPRFTLRLRLPAPEGSSPFRAGSGGHSG